MAEEKDFKMDPKLPQPQHSMLKLVLVPKPEKPKLSLRLKKSFIMFKTLSSSGLIATYGLCWILNLLLTYQLSDPFYIVLTIGCTILISIGSACDLICSIWVYREHIEQMRSNLAILFLFYTLFPIGFKIFTNLVGLPPGKDHLVIHEIYACSVMMVIFVYTADLGAILDEFEDFLPSIEEKAVPCEKCTGKNCINV